MKNLLIPSRFESVLNNAIFNPAALIYKVDKDLESYQRLSNLIKTRSGGIMSFLVGESGAGKTTSAYAAATYLKDIFNPVISVPPEIELRNAAAWIQKNIPDKNNKTNIVLFDGREYTDDGAGLHQFISTLNQLLRKRGDILFIWPTTDESWRSHLRENAEKVGGSNLAPKKSDIKILGPRKENWTSILERLFIQLDLTLDEAGLDHAYIQGVASKEKSIGDFLATIGDEISDRKTLTQSDLSLPEIVFIISSGESVSGEANRLRRAGILNLKAEELISYSPRSKSGKYWKERSSNPQHHLAYIISLFNVKLLTLSSSAVAYSCLHLGSDTISKAVSASGLKKNTSNLQKTFTATDFYKFYKGEISSELTSTRKGKNSDQTTGGYHAIQSISAKKHKEINQAICKTLAKYYPEISDANFTYEIDAGDQNLFTDAILENKSLKHHLEFHHLSEANCSAAKMASYIMGKLLNYAIHYNLIPR
jgi:hypothetical protein